MLLIDAGYFVMFAGLGFGVTMAVLVFRRLVVGGHLPVQTPPEPRRIITPDQP